MSIFLYFLFNGNQNPGETGVLQIINYKEAKIGEHTIVIQGKTYPIILQNWCHNFNAIKDDRYKTELLLEYDRYVH